MTTHLIIAALALLADYGLRGGRTALLRHVLHVERAHHRSERKAYNAEQENLRTRNGELYADNVRQIERRKAAEKYASALHRERDEIQAEATATIERLTGELDAMTNDFENLLARYRRVHPAFRADAEQVLTLTEEPEPIIDPLVDSLTDETVRALSIPTGEFAFRWPDTIYVDHEDILPPLVAASGAPKHVDPTITAEWVMPELVSVGATRTAVRTPALPQRTYPAKAQPGRRTRRKAAKSK
jgi:hypothetical protein